MDVVILGSAEQDIKELRRYLVKNFSVGVWQTTYAKLKHSIRNLERFPQLGDVPDELESLNMSQYRQVISGMNRVIYEVRQETVYIHIVADSRRDMKTLLARRLLRIV